MIFCFVVPYIITALSVVSGHAYPVFILWCPCDQWSERYGTYAVLIFPLFSTKCYIVPSLVTSIPT